MYRYNNFLHTRPMWIIHEDVQWVRLHFYNTVKKTATKRIGSHHQWTTCTVISFFFHRFQLLKTSVSSYEDIEELFGEVSSPEVS